MGRTLLSAATIGRPCDVLFTNDVRTRARRPLTGMNTTALGQRGHSAEGQVHGMGIISWIILGLLAGAIAKFLLPGRDPGGFIGTTLIGIAGAFIGGWISARWLDHPISKDFYDGATWAAAIGGSLVLLIAYRILFGNSRD
jgi:uncharacterized membrane protein YeaQ/YmgE (transglycosylase-associated protein family)